MRKILILAVCIVAVCALSFSIVAYAHSGKTDSNGGHWNHYTGEYHYHHGYSAHTHSDMDGDGDIDCPYEFDDNTYHDSDSNTTQKEESIFIKILKVIGLSILTGLVGLSSCILPILYSLLMAPIEFLIKKHCDQDSQEKMLEKCGAIVMVLFAIAIVAIVTIIIF